MILTEYDEKKYKKMFYRDGVQEGESIGLERGIKIGEERGEARGIRIGEERGEARGVQIALISLVCTKLEKGKSIPEIADSLECDEDEIRKICHAAERVTPRYNAQAIYEFLNKD